MNEQSMNAAAFDRWQATYDADVLACDQAGEYPFAGYCQLMEQLFQLVHSREGVSVLELGCGTGLLAGRLERAGHPVTGVDFSEKMLAQARKNAPDSVFTAARCPSSRRSLQESSLTASSRLTACTTCGTKKNMPFSGRCGPVLRRRAQFWWAM